MSLAWIASAGMDCPASRFVGGRCETFDPGQTASSPCAGFVTLAPCGLPPAATTSPERSGGRCARNPAATTSSTPRGLLVENSHIAMILHLLEKGYPTFLEKCKATAEARSPWQLQTTKPSRKRERTTAGTPERRHCAPFRFPRRKSVVGRAAYLVLTNTGTSARDCAPSDPWTAIQ